MPGTGGWAGAQVRRLASAAARRWRRLRYAGTVNRPYLSGDLFRSLCHVALDERRTDEHFASHYHEARAIFVKTDRLGEFLRDFAAGATACRVLITGNSDADIHAAPAGLPTGLRRWFAQNTLVTSDTISPLPIGLENQALGVNGRLRHIRRCTAAEIGAKQLRLFAAFARTTPERDGLLTRLAASALVDAEDRRMPPRPFQARLRRYRFVIAPRGNGLDTHRLWEALYADAIPVTLATPWSRALKAEGLPLLDVDRWDDILAWSVHDIARWSATFPARPSSLPWLWEPFWHARISALVDGGSTTRDGPS